MNKLFIRIIAGILLIGVWLVAFNLTVFAGEFQRSILYSIFFGLMSTIFTLKFKRTEYHTGFLYYFLRNRLH